MQNLLDNKLIVITGFGRSGTTILGKIMGSMDNTVYSFEPAIMKALPEFYNYDVPAKMLFETHLLPEIQGRGNMNRCDDSYTLNYMSGALIDANCNFLRRREDAEKFLEDNDYKFIVKNTMLQYYMGQIDWYFPGVRFVHIIRNGPDAISSAIQRGWYTNDYCNADAVENMIPGLMCDISPTIDSDCRELWEHWNPTTRAACDWRCAVEHGLRYKHNHPDSCVQFRYDDFVAKPKKYVKYLEKKFDLQSTYLTRGHLGNIYDAPRYCKDMYDDIAEPERTKFITLNKRLGYEI